MAFHHQSQGYQLASYSHQQQYAEIEQHPIQCGSQAALYPPQDLAPAYNVADSKPGAGAGRPGTHPWKSGFFSRFPWSAVASLLLSVCCTIAAAVLLRKVDGRPVSEWSSNLQPSVILAYTSTVGNALMAAALAEAATIYFWRKTIQGTNVMDLHYNWLAGHGLWGAIKSIFKWRALAVSCGCLLVGVTGLLRGPLLQRAAAVETRVVTINSTLDLGIAAAVPETWGGTVVGSTRQKSTLVSPSFSKVLVQYQNREPIQLLTPPCDNCTMSVEGFGFHVSCTNNTEAYNITAMRSKGSSDVEIFSTNATTDVDTSRTTGGSVFGWVVISTLLKSEPTCEGELKLQTCELHPATMLYNLSMSGTNVTFASQSWKADNFVKEVNLTSEMQIPSLGGTMGALGNFGTSSFTADADEIFSGAAGFSLAVSGYAGHTYLAGRGADADQSGCNYTFNDPTDDMINSFREFAFRMAVQAAQDDTTLVQRGVPYLARHTEIVYVVNYVNLGIAVFISLLGPLALLPLLWGWWSLGRSVSMSPVETANAMAGGQGLFAGVGGNATPDEMVDVLGQRRNMRYGVNARTGRLALAEDDGEIRVPGKGEML